MGRMAAECAHLQGRFEAFHDVLFEQQDSLGLKAWTKFAEQSGVPDRRAFEACINKGDRDPKVEQGIAFGNRIDARGTPTILLNGWMLAAPPSLAQLRESVRAIRDGKPPFPGAKP